MATAPSTRLYINRDDNCTEEERFEASEVVQVFTCDGSFYKNITVSAVNYTTQPYYVEIMFTWDAANAGKIGWIQKKGSISELDPVVVKSASFEEKTKANTKNINYTIDIDKAYPINVQRN